MTERLKSKKWKMRTLTAVSAALAASLAFSGFSACAKKTTNETDEETPASPTDTQLLKNGDFEFYNDNDYSDLAKKTGIINSPRNWTFTSGSPSSDTASGIINIKDWEYYTKTGGYPFKTFQKGEGDEAKEVTTFESIDEAAAHFEDDNVSAYDRIRFLDAFEDEIEELPQDSESSKLFAKYNYSVDFDDVKDLSSDFPESVSLREGEGTDPAKTSVLMIHNSRTSDDVRGTAQYYTSGTTISLSAGTSAKIKVYVRTDKLFHYQDTELKARGGAYIGVVNTVGGTTLDQMQIYNINTQGQWREYTVYVRASTFATSTFRIVLGLGQGSSDDRYFSVDGYAFFDDVSCEIISNSDYENAVMEDGALKDGVRGCSVDSLRDEKRFDTDSVSDRVFALDLYAGFPDQDLLGDEPEIKLTEEKSGSKVYTSQDIDPSLNDDHAQNFTALTNLNELASSSNAYVKNVYEKDFKDKFPFENENLVMLLSGNGAAYTAKITSEKFTLDPETRLLISFFVKTSKISTGLIGAGATVVEGDSKTEINGFDSTTLTTVDIDSKSDDPEKKDIYKGWTQCFFFLENTTDEQKTFYLELTFGPKTITSTTKFSYGDGYAAFANFESKYLTKTEYSYASTGDRAKKVSLTGGVEDTKQFDSVSVTDEKGIETRPALPANFRGVLGGSDFVQKNETEVPNIKPEGVTAGLVSSKYAEAYYTSEESFRSVLDFEGADSAESWWQGVFGNSRQPLLIINPENVSYGYFADSATVSSSSYQRISMRVKASKNAKAYLYLTETNVDKIGKSISLDLPFYSYWYDDDGNVVNMDPSDEKFDEEGKILYELQPNGLYCAAEGGETYYANLYNYDVDSEGNKVTKDGEIVFYYHNNAYYAYRTEDKNGNYEYNTPVHNLPIEIARYNFSDRGSLPLAQMEIVGTGEWETISFYLHTGSEEKGYRLEVWNGSRDGKTTNPANSYVLFDNFSSENISSDYSSLLNEAVGQIKDRLNEGKTLGDSENGYLSDDDPLPEHDLDCYRALYYTFSFFDSNAYVRYDETQDENKLGNPWGSYQQSTYNEQLVSLYFANEKEDGTTSYSFYLDYSAVDVTVTADDLTPDTDDEENASAATTTDSEMNIWLLISSGILAVVLFVVIILVVVRRAVEKKSKRTRIKPVKA